MLKGIDEAIDIAITQGHLAKILGVGQQTVSKWHKRGHVPFKRAEQINKLYGIPITELIDPRLVNIVKEDINAN